MGTRLQIKSMSTGKYTDDCGKFYGYCNYEDAKESFNFLIDLHKQGKIEFNDWVSDKIENDDYKEAFFFFTLGPCFGDITLLNEDFIKFIDLHNKEAWKLWKREGKLTDVNDYDNWYFKQQCDELEQILDEKRLEWS